MAIIEIDPVTDSAWISFIEQFQKADIFHHPAWIKLISNKYKFRTFSVCSTDKDGNIRAGIPFCEYRFMGTKKWISLPFSDHCMPLFDSNGYLDELIQYLIEKNSAGNVDHIEIRQHVSQFPNVSRQVLHILDLSNNKNEVFDSFKDSHKRGIKKSLREGLSSKVSVSEEGVEIFYKLHLKTRKKQGVPIQPKSFFTSIYRELISKGLGFIVLVETKSKPLAAGLFLKYNKTVTYKFGASDPRLLIYRPNNLMFWTAIEYAIDSKYHFFDFGKTDVENEGLRAFKSGWSAIEYPLSFSYFPSLPGNAKFNFINKKIIKPIIQISPPFVCRITGELFYKYSL